jgi:glutathione peroxidase-family protein
LILTCIYARAKTLEGVDFDFAQLRGKAVLITNVACLCGFTNKNYEQLVQLHKQYEGKMEILAFPSNEFGNQEPKPAAEIRQFVNDFGVKFVMVRPSLLDQCIYSIKN